MFLSGEGCNRSVRHPGRKEDEIDPVYIADDDVL